MDVHTTQMCCVHIHVLCGRFLNNKGPQIIFIQFGLGLGDIINYPVSCFLPSRHYSSHNCTSVEFGTFVNHRMSWVCVIQSVFEFLVVGCRSQFYSVYERECYHLPFLSLVGGKSSENLNGKFVAFQSSCLMYVRYLNIFGQ